MANVFQITISAVDRATAVAQKVNASIAKITKPIADVKASVASFSKETGLDSLGRSLSKVGGIAKDAAGKIGSIAPPLAAIASVGTIAGIAGLAHSWGRTATEIANTASVIGVSTDQLQKYRGAARLAGLSDADMTSGLKAVGAAFEDAAAGRDTFTAGVLADKGIGIHRLKNGSVDTVRALHDISNAASKITNAQAREKFLQIFGLGNLAPLLVKGGKAIDEYVAKYEKLNATMSPEQIAKGERFNESMVALDASVGNLKNTVGAALTPALTRLADRLEPIANEYGPKLAGWIDSINWDKAISSTEKFVGAVGGVKTIAAAVAAITFAGPIAGAISLVTQLTKMGMLLAPIAANPVVAGILGLTHSKDLNTGEDDKLIDIRKKEQYALAHGGWTAEMSKPGWRPPEESGAASGSVPVANPSGNAAGGRSPLGVRSNNPLNMTMNGRERVYATPEEGIAAAVGNLRRNYAGLTLAQIQNKWTGGARTGNSPEQIANYTKTMSQATGLASNAIPNLSDPRVVSSLVSGMIRAENGQMPYSAQQLGAGILLGMQRSGGAGSDDSRFAATPSSQELEANAGGAAGTVQVDVRFINAPKGMRTSISTRGNVSATANIGTSALMEPAI